MRLSPEDESALRSLVGRAAVAADEEGPESYRNIYTTDGVFDFGGAPQTGVDAIIAATAERREEGTSGPGSGTRHVVVPMAFEQTGDDEATGKTYLTFLADTNATPRVALVGVYHDTFRRVDGEWKINYRRVSVG